MRVFRNKAVEALTVALYIIRYCQGLPMGARDISRTLSAVNIPNVGVSVENIFDTRTRPDSMEKLFSISGPEPGNPVQQENGHWYERPNEPRRLIDESKTIITSINILPPQQPIQRANKMNFDVDPLNHHSIDKTEVRYMPTIKPQLKGNGQINRSPSTLDIIVFKNDDENKIVYTEDIESSTKSFSTNDYTGTADYESTTYEDDLALRIGVSDQLAASLLG